MINAEELAICKRRGHDTRYATITPTDWTQCRWCGMWKREVHTVEEREDEPPEQEKSAFARPVK
jgi:hypothetical protein